MSQGAFLTNLGAKRYAKSPIADQVSYEKKLALTRKYFTPASEVLEIGCGTGSTAILHAPFVKSIEGIDYAKNMVAIANQKASDEGVTNATFSVEDVDDLASKLKRYDVVMGMNIIHLLDDQATALKNIYNLLKPGGVFISSTVSSFDIPWYLNALVKMLSAVRIFPTINVLSEENLKKNIETAGFSIFEQWNHGNKFKVSFLVAKKKEY